MALEDIKRHMYSIDYSYMKYNGTMYEFSFLENDVVTFHAASCDGPFEKELYRGTPKFVEEILDHLKALEWDSPYFAAKLINEGAIRWNKERVKKNEQAKLRRQRRKIAQQKEQDK